MKGAIHVDPHTRISDVPNKCFGQIWPTLIIPVCSLDFVQLII
jgi:hypothetical protein